MTDSWYKQTGGFTKGRIYGFGKGDDAALMLVGAKAPPSNEKETLEALFQEKLLAIEADRQKEREEMEARRQKDKEEMDAKMEDMKKMMLDIIGSGNYPQA